MKPFSKNATSHKAIRITVITVVVVVFCVVALFCYMVWGWMLELAELAAECDSGRTVWRRNPGAFSSYVYEIRDGKKTIETGLRMKQLDDFLGDDHCTFLGGG